MKSERVEPLKKEKEDQRRGKEHRREKDQKKIGP